MTSAKVICDSISPTEVRLTSIEVKFHRFILPEVNTYKMISKSASSSRAVPISKRLEEVRERPQTPVEWGKNQRGMVAEEMLDEDAAHDALRIWLEAGEAAAIYAKALDVLGVHRQVASRLLEPFIEQTMLLTSVDYQNMFRQRIHPDAQPEFRELAIAIKEAYDASEPGLIGYGEWTLPYVLDEERYMDISILKKLSVARVARTSYGNQSQADIEKDLQLFDRLRNAEPPHSAPFEPVATPAHPGVQVLGNYPGWHQFRHIMESEKRDEATKAENK